MNTASMADTSRLPTSMLLVSRITLGLISYTLNRVSCTRRTLCPSVMETNSSFLASVMWMGVPPLMRWARVVILLATSTTSSVSTSSYFNSSLVGVVVSTAKSTPPFSTSFSVMLLPASKIFSLMWG